LPLVRRSTDGITICPHIGEVETQGARRPDRCGLRPAGSLSFGRGVLFGGWREVGKSVVVIFGLGKVSG